MKKLNIKTVAVEAVAIGAGAVLAAKSDTLLDKVKFLTGKGVLKGAAKVAGGVLVGHFFGKGKSAGIAKAASAGIIAIGAAQLANGTIFKSNPVSIAGTDGLPTLGNVDASSFINEDYVSGPTVGSPDNLSI